MTSVQALVWFLLSFAASALFGLLISKGGADPLLCGIVGGWGGPYAVALLSMALDDEDDDDWHDEAEA